ncbi:hypothetical protein EVAR_59517_1 [Eumeta japonica]|uniref:Uncharacterized protein n=1 Tax=Eumeta variegata TaxID=151549 RepID=A0A4C1XUM7_EUMVA|nr:hypothetical protein EVAR_59517_1 [Eumeta japonica]
MTFPPLSRSAFDKLAAREIFCNEFSHPALGPRYRREARRRRPLWDTLAFRRSCPVSITGNLIFCWKKKEVKSQAQTLPSSRRGKARKQIYRVHYLPFSPPHFNIALKQLLAPRGEQTRESPRVLKDRFQFCYKPKEFPGERAMVPRVP